MKKVIFILLSLILFACSKQVKINNTIIKKTLNNFNKNNLFCLKIYPNVDEKLNFENNYIGEDLIKIKYTNEKGKKINKRAIRQMEVLLDNNFYYQEKDQLYVDPTTSKQFYIARYILSNNGKKYMSHNKGICIGNNKLDDIIWYSTPYLNDGKIISRVVYTNKIKLFKWAKDFLKYSSNIDDKNKKRIYGNYEETTYLIKQGKKWKDIRQTNFNIKNN